MLNSFPFLRVSLAFASGTMGVKTRDEDKQPLALPLALCVLKEPSPCSSLLHWECHCSLLSSTGVNIFTVPFSSFLDSCHLPGCLYELRILILAECTQILTFASGRICSLWLFVVFFPYYFLAWAGYKILILTKKKNKFNCDDLSRKSIHNSGNLMKNVMCCTDI